MYRSAAHTLGNITRYAPTRQLTPAAKQHTLLHQVQSWRTGGQSTGTAPNGHADARDFSSNRYDRRFGQRANSIGELSESRAPLIHSSSLAVLPRYAVPQRRTLSNAAAGQSQDTSDQTQDPREYNERIKVLKRDGNLLGVVREYALMKSLGTPRNLLTYNMVLDAFVDLRQRDTSMRPMMDVYRDILREPDFRPSSYTYRVAIRGLCIRELEVCRLRSQLETRLQWVDDNADRARLAALSAEANLEQAMQIFDQARTDIAEPFDVNALDLLLWATAERGDTQASLRVFEAIEASPFMTPSAQTFAALISSFGRANDLEAARECFQVFLEQREALSSKATNPEHMLIPYNSMIKALMRSGETEDARRMIEEEMPASGIEPDAISYNTLITGMTQAGDINGAEHYFNKLLESPDLPNPSELSHNVLLSAACKHDALPLANRVMALIRDAGLNMRYGNLMAYLELCVRSDNAQGAAEVLVMLENNRDVPDTHFRQLFQLLLQRHGISSEDKLLLTKRLISMKHRYANREQLLREVIATHIDATPGEFAAHFLLIESFCSHSSRLSTRLGESFMHSYRAFREHAGLAELAKIMTVDIYIVLIATWFDRARSIDPVDRVVDDVIALLQDMKAIELKPGPTTLANWSDRIGKISDSATVERWNAQCAELFGDIVAKSVYTEGAQRDVRSSDRLTEPHSIEIWRLCNELRAIVRNPAHLGKSEEGFTQLLATGALPPPDIVRMLIQCYSTARRLDGVTSVLNRVLAVYDRIEDPQERNSLRHQILNTAITSYSKNGDAETARQLYEMLRAAGQTPSRPAYGELLRVYKGVDDLEEGLRMYGEMRCVPSPYFANVLLGKLARKRGLDEAVRLFEELRQRGMQPTSVTYGTIISAACKESNEHVASSYFNELCRRSEQDNNPAPFHAMMQYSLSKGDRASVLRYLTTMRRHMTNPVAHTYRLLIEAYTYVAPRDMSLAEQSLRDLLKAQISPTGAHYAPLLTGYADEDRMDKVKKLWYELKLHPHLPDETAYLSAIAAAEKCSESEFAHHLRSELFAYSGNSTETARSAPASVTPAPSTATTDSAAANTPLSSPSTLAETDSTTSTPVS